jgi:hypothetical protein
MPTRRNLFLIHAWDDADTYSDAVALLKARDAELADYSVPPWKEIEGSDAAIERGIRSRIRSANAVVVVNSDGLHRREWSGREMAIAVELDKPIVVLQPRDNFWLPIPQALDGNIYRVSSWRGDALGRAVRGEAPHDSRVFDIAELRDRLDIVKTLAAGVVCASLVVIGVSVNACEQLSRELAAQGVRIEWTEGDAATVKRFAFGGAIVGGIAAALYTRSLSGAVLGAAAGGLAGAALGTTLVYRAAVHGTRDLRVVTIELV